MEQHLLFSYVYAYTCICIYGCVHMCLCICKCVYICVYMWMWLCLYICTYIKHLFLYVYIYTYICINTTNSDDTGAYCFASAANLPPGSMPLFAISSPRFIIGIPSINSIAKTFLINWKNVKILYSFKSKKLWK